MGDINWGILSPAGPGLKTVATQANPVAPPPVNSGIDAIGQANQIVQENQRMGLLKNADSRQEQLQPGVMQSQQLQNQGQGLLNQKMQNDANVAKLQMQRNQEVSKAFVEGQTKGGTQAGFDAAVQRKAELGDVDGAMTLAKSTEDLRKTIAEDNTKQIVGIGSAIHGIMSSAVPPTPSQRDPQTGQIIPGNPGKSPLDIYREQYQTVKQMYPRAPSPDTFKTEDDFENNFVHPVLATALPIQEKIAAEQKALTENDLYKIQSVVKQRQQDLQNSIKVNGATSNETKTAATALSQAQAEARRISVGGAVSGTFSSVKSMLPEILGGTPSENSLIKQNSPQLSGNVNPAPLHTTPVTNNKTINGVTYINQNGKWYSK